MHKYDLFLYPFSGGGSVQKDLHPAIIVQNDVGNTRSPTTIVCPITSRKKTHLPTHVFLPRTSCNLKKDSTVLCEQIMTVDRSCLGKYIGTLRDVTLRRAVDEALSVSLDLKTPSHPADAYLPAQSSADRILSR